MQSWGKEDLPPLLCPPCNANIIHLFHTPNNTTSNTFDVAYFYLNSTANNSTLENDGIFDETGNTTTPSPSFDHAINNEDNAKNAERALLHKHENYYLCNIKYIYLY